MHPFPGNLAWSMQSSVQSCILYGLPTRLVQELNIGTVNLQIEKETIGLTIYTDLYFETLK